MKKLILTFLISISLLTPTKKAHADLFGGDVAVLMQILVQAIEQYIKLKEMLETAQSNLKLLEDVNSGIDTILGQLETIYPESNLRVYSDWKSFSRALKQAQKIYGKAPDSKDRVSQENMDTSFVESMLMYNNIAKHSKMLDKVAERIKSLSQSASPKGAVKLTAQTLGISLQVQNEMLRTQAAQLKVQAQDMAYKNKIEKEETEVFLNTANSLKNKLKKLQPQFKTPRY